MNLNKTMLAGNITADLELRHTPSGLAWTAFSVAVNRRWKNEQGNPQQETTFVSCQAWGKSAEILCKYMSKGKPIYVEGRLSQHSFVDKDGKKNSKTRVVVEEFQFLPSGHQTQTGARTSPEPPVVSAPSLPQTEICDDDNLPF